MPLKKPNIENVANIKVVGIGGGGNAALNRMVEAQMKGVEFVAINTDAQALHYSGAPSKLHIGQNVTRGLGAGMNPSVGQQAAEENREEIHELFKGADMVFTTGGFGGGTASGALPVISEIAKDAGALTVGIVTKPFTFEGHQRMTIADDALSELNDKVDAGVVIPNDRLLQIIDKKTSLVDAFRVVDDVLRQGVQGISDLITQHGMVNVDFADVKAIMSNAGSALMGIGRASGENRAVEAARAAIESPMLDVTIDGAKGIVFNITAGDDLGMHEVEQAARTITEHADPNAKVIFGAVMDDSQVEENEIKITVVATGFEKGEPAAQQHQPRTAGAPQTPSGPFQPGQPASPFPQQQYGQPSYGDGGGQPNQGRPVYGPPQSAPPQQPQQPSQPQQSAQPQQPQNPQQPNQGSGQGGGQGQSGADSGDDEDLDVPTFIRRKMRERKQSGGTEGE